MTQMEQERLNRLVWTMLDYYSGDAPRVQHFTKVYTYVDWIARGEGAMKRPSICCLWWL